LELSFSSKELRDTCNSNRKLKRVYPEEASEIKSLLSDINCFSNMIELQGIYETKVVMTKVGVIGHQVILWVEAIPKKDLESSQNQAVLLENIFRLKLVRIELKGERNDSI